MNERTKAPLVWPVAGFFVVIAFGVGLIAEAALGGRIDLSTTSSSGEFTDAKENPASFELGESSTR
jgi:hypothetical protein